MAAEAPEKIGRIRDATYGKYGRFWQDFQICSLRLRGELKTDVSDIVQTVWQAFFRRAGKAKEFPRSQDLMSFLTRTAAYLVAKQFQYYHLARRNIDQEGSLEDLSHADRDKLADRSPDPADVALGNERLASRLAVRRNEANKGLGRLKKGSPRLSPAA
jgi:hypothetical protein